MRERTIGNSHTLVPHHTSILPLSLSLCVCVTLSFHTYSAIFDVIFCSKVDEGSDINVQSINQIKDETLEQILGEHCLSYLLIKLIGSISLSLCVYKIKLIANSSARNYTFSL